jgi:hypothetical protein
MIAAARPQAWRNASATRSNRPPRPSADGPGHMGFSTLAQIPRSLRAQGLDDVDAGGAGRGQGRGDDRGDQQGEG